MKRIWLQAPCKCSNFRQKENVLFLSLWSSMSRKDVSSEGKGSTSAIWRWVSLMLREHDHRERERERGRAYCLFQKVPFIGISLFNTSHKLLFLERIQILRKSPAHLISFSLFGRKLASLISNHQWWYVVLEGDLYYYMIYVKVQMCIHTIRGVLAPQKCIF